MANQTTTSWQCRLKSTQPKKRDFTAAQNELRAAEANLQKAQEELAAFLKRSIGLPGA